MMRSKLWWAGLTLALLGMACSSVEEAPDPGGTGGTGGTGGEIVQPLSIVSVSAPDEYTVRIVLSAAPPPEATELPIYGFAGEGGALEVLAAALDPAANTITLTTGKQKLGVGYDLALSRPDSALDGLGASFLAADTATFWVVDLGSPQFTQYQVTADRNTIGTHTVIYIEQGMVSSPSDIATAVDLFDNTTYDTETALFHAMPDSDGNGRVVLLGLDGKGAYGGYFDPTNTLTDAQAMQQMGYHSNEMELLHINIEWGDFDYWQVIVAHEFQHLLYEEQHPWSNWNYHNEGLAECAVHAVLGQNDLAMQHYLADPQGGIAAGESLVIWTYANYDQYVLAYLYWTYIASQLGGVSAYGDLFDVNGDPSSIQSFLQASLGKTFAETELAMLIAARVQAATGENGFNGMLNVGGTPPVSTASSLNLAPFAGTYIDLGVAVTSVDYPGTQGADIVYAGITGAGAVDLAAPFDVTNGVLVVLNAKFAPNGSAAEPSGPNLLPVTPKLAAPLAPSSRRGVVLPNGHDPAWLHPPPFNPSRLDQMRAWQVATQVGR
ncbi:MAG: hypothetical protein IT373_25490 [Polyangiaceae bacterium]|nr:hypothetical protein [Polyangiaceae bacterium]